REHLSDNFVEGLPHMCRVTQYLEDRVADGIRGSDSAWAEIDCMIATLERELVSGDDEVDNLIGVSFIENLLGPDAADREIAYRLRPALQDELRRMRSWYERRDQN